MRGYAETERCRMQFLLGYFGERDDRLCGRCDRCRAGTAAEAAMPQGSQGSGGSTYQPDERVEHPTFGVGTVVDADRDTVTVLFEEVGYRVLKQQVVEDRGLLEEVD